jgi:hypothetical protein
MMESGETSLNNHWLGNRGGSLSFLVGTISNVLVMEIGWTDVGSGGYILVSCAHSNTSLLLFPNLELVILRKRKFRFLKIKLILNGEGQVLGLIEVN